MKPSFNKFMLGMAFASSVAVASSENPSVLDDTFDKNMVEYVNNLALTLEGHRAHSLLSTAKQSKIPCDFRPNSALVYAPSNLFYDAPFVFTYADGIWGCYLAVADNIHLGQKGKKVFETLLKQKLPDNPHIQLVIQDISQFPTHWNNDWPTNGGITKGQAAPLSLKAQMPYGIYNMEASGSDPTGQFDQHGREIRIPYIFDQPGGRKFRNWSTDGYVDVKMTLLEEGN